ncbi:MAG TPA: FAD/NAD(P)-binding protein [Mycobacteriales bacterium]|nr:FAD/NAD(P)-binding protein [Mycobacteriales bacterium]
MVIGGGPAGALTVMRLLEGARDGDVVVVEPAEALGRGTAFATRDQAHLLNVPVGNMSARPEVPDDFVRWLAGAGLPTPPTAFVPRHLFGHYVDERLTAAALSSAARLHHVRARVTALAPGAPRSAVTLDDGRCLEADAVVLAVGTAPPDLSFAPASLRSDPRLIPDPWAPGALLEVPRDRDVLLVGTGLTMADVALSLMRPGRRVHAISRHGLLPHPHLVPAQPAAPAPDLADCTDLDALRAAVRGHVAATIAAQGDWRPAIDGLRSQLQSCWQRLPLADRLRFLREDLRAWEVRRHRMAPRTAEALQAAVTNGDVVLHTGTVLATDDRDGDLVVHLSDRSRVRVGAVVACTGGIGALEEPGDPLLRSLLRDGTARPGPVGLGLDTASDGRLRDGSGAVHAGVWTLGALRRGNLWETTAIPEIRGQAAEVADAVLAQVSERPRQRVA